MLARLGVWHRIALALSTTAALLIAWFAIAYGGLPRLWSHHEHKKIGGRDEIISYTAQDIPADPINLRLIGSAAQIDCAFRRAGWTLADAVSAGSAVEIAESVVLGRPYPAAPVSPLYVRDQVQDFAYQLDDGNSANRRHHVRFWQIGPKDWLAAATYDRGVGVSLFTLQVTHHIGSDVDAERARVGSLVIANGGRLLGEMPSRIAAGRSHRNGGGDLYFTDGVIRAYSVGRECATRSPQSG